MPITAVIGTQWGDEGKGRIVDYLAQRADLVVRFQGGDNAGHTVVNDHGKFALHMIPSGIFNPDCLCLVGTGCVVNPTNLLAELATLEAAGLDTRNLLISSRAHLVMPYHPEIDALEEAAREGDEKIGTTKRGIGPAYADKYARIGLRVGELLHPEHFEKRLRIALDKKAPLFERLGAAPPTLDALLDIAAGWREALAHRIVDTTPILQDALLADRFILLEGQLGAMRDVDWGIYPYVTSSNPTAAFAAAGAGLPPQAVTDALGVVKAYSTAVGAGPFPVELFDADGERLREIGQEFGATTGRPRRCGWFDALAVRHSAWLNGLTGLAVTKLDVLDTFETIQVCVAYELDGIRFDHMPDTPLLDRVTPIYESWPGWQCDTSAARTWDELPDAAQRYLRRLAELSEVPITFVSVGPERDQLITEIPETV